MKSMKVKAIKDKPTQSSSYLRTTIIDDNISVVSGANGSSFFTSKDFNATIKDLTDRFDQVFLCSSNRNAYIGLMALSVFSPCLVMISGLRRTKKNDIKSIKSSYPIDLLFHD